MRSFFVTAITLFVLSAATIPALAGTVGGTTPNPANAPSPVASLSPGSPVLGAGAQGTLTAPHLLTCLINRRKTLFQWTSKAAAFFQIRFRTLEDCFAKVEMYRIDFMTPNCGSAPWAVQDPDGVCRKNCWDLCIKKGADGLTATGTINPQKLPWKGAACHISYGPKGAKTCYIGYAMASISTTDPRETPLLFDKNGQPVKYSPPGTSAGTDTKSPVLG